MAAIWIDGFHEPSWGWILTGATPKGLCACHVLGPVVRRAPGHLQPSDLRAVAEPFLRALFPGHDLLWEGNDVSRAARHALTDYLRGSKRHPEVPVDWVGGTAFQRSVWRELCRIPYGAAVTYGDIAQRVGRPLGARAVGQACGKNPTAIVVPCHRVVGRNGSLGGYSGGLDVKEALLRLEGITIDGLGHGRESGLFLDTVTTRGL